MIFPPLIETVRYLLARARKVMPVRSLNGHLLDRKRSRGGEAENNLLEKAASQVSLDCANSASKVRCFDEA